MKKRFITMIIIIICLFVFFGQFVFSYPTGYYNPTFRIVSCRSVDNCYHEIGHAIDHSEGWISKSQEYAIALNAYILRAWDHPQFKTDMVTKVLTFPGFFVPSNPGKDPFSTAFWRGGWGGTTELYADMLSWTYGQRENMPEYFIPFYDWDLAEQLIAKYIGE